MKIRNFAHKGLQRFYEDDIAKGIPAPAVGKLRDQLTFLESMTDADELYKVPVWKVHQLKGSRRMEWSFSVTKNWRLTFWIDAREAAVCDLNLEDYH